jgi:hypothetical protein
MSPLTVVPAEMIESVFSAAFRAAERPELSSLPKIAIVPRG